MCDKHGYKKALCELADELEDMRNAFGTIEVAHNRCLDIPDVEKNMMIGCALKVICSAFEKVDNIYCQSNK